MRIPLLATKVLAVCGCWPLTSSGYKRVLCNVYTSFVLFMELSFSLSQFMGILSIDNVDDFSEYTYMFLTVSTAFYKVVNIQLYRENIVRLGELLMEEPFAPVTIEEMDVQRRYNQHINVRTKQYIVVTQLTVATTIMNTFVTDFPKKNLAYKAWFPFNYSPTRTFCLVYFYQIWSILLASFIFMSVDVLLCGFFLQLCCQFEILQCRFKQIVNGRNNTIGKCIQHYERIYQFAGMVNDTFKSIFFIQYFVSALVVCVSLYQMLKTDIPSIEFFALLTYLSCMVMQIFIYCWYGNEVKLKSLHVSDMIFSMDWTNFNHDVKKVLLIIMSRSLVPIEFTSASVITINIDSFVSIMKASYSVFNLLQQTKK